MGPKDERGNPPLREARAPRRGRPGIAMLVFAALVVITGCASTGSTFGSGVGDARFDHPPYYAGSRASGLEVSIGHLPISYQRGAAQGYIFDPSGTPETPIAELLAEMNVFMDSIRGATALSVPAANRTTPPDVRFGCEPVAFDECEPPSDETHLGKRRMRLAVGRPSQSWVAAVAPALDQAGHQGVLVITLEVGQYWVQQKNLFGAKEVRLGSGYKASLPWLSSLDQPVQVLQLTGAVVDRDGRAHRIGAEGLFARRTNIILSGFGAQELITDSDVERIRSLRRDDLAGQPLVWQVALANLLAQLTGDPTLAFR